jgi:hypothetical protein
MLKAKKILMFLMLLNPMLISSQTCDSLVPFFAVDLSSDPDSVWISSAVQRAGYCCGSVYPEVCVEFEVTISSSAIGIIVNIISTQLPMGAVYTKNNCADPLGLGSPLYLSSPGPHQITFCKPGNSMYQYSIESIPATAGVANYDKVYPIKIYPNPANDFIIIESKYYSNQTFKLIDISGRAVFSGTVREKEEIKLGSISPGFYIVEILSNNQSVKKKIIIE